MNKLPKIVVIVGPTATNKTKLAIDIANQCNGEIINADAYQVYKDFSIGVNCPSIQQQQSAKFHLLSCIDPQEQWDIKKFQSRANNIIKELINKNKLPIIVGGSNLYVDALINNYSLQASARNSSFEQLTDEQLYNQLVEYDKDSASINKNNRRRLIRALQIYSQGQVLKSAAERLYDVLIISCEMERELLYQRINMRALAMLKDGWIQEVQSLINKYPNWQELPAFKAIGYALIANALIHKHEIDTQRIMQLTRNYAKRQVTWIKHHYPNTCVFNQKNYDSIIATINQWLTK